MKWQQENEEYRKLVDRDKCWNLLFFDSAQGEHL